MPDDPKPNEDTGTPNPEPTPPPETKPTPGASAGAQPDDVGSLPEWAQKLIRDTRQEAATHRTKANEISTKHQEALDAIAAALGLKGDDDPATAAKTAAEERDAARQEARATKIENAVLRIAAKHGANPEALTDSRSFMKQLEAIDPAAEDFAAQVDAAVKKAVEANPSLKGASPAPARSGGPVGGGAAIPVQLTREDLLKMSPEEIVQADKDGRLKSIKGG